MGKRLKHQRPKGKKKSLKTQKALKWVGNRELSSFEVVITYKTCYVGEEIPEEIQNAVLQLRARGISDLNPWRSMDERKVFLWGLNNFNEDYVYSNDVKIEDIRTYQKGSSDGPRTKEEYDALYGENGEKMGKCKPASLDDCSCPACKLQANKNPTQ